MTIRQAPYCGTIRYKHLSSLPGFTLNATDVGTGVNITWSGADLDAPFRIVSGVVGKEYGSIASPYPDKTVIPDVCDTNTLWCVPDPAGSPVGLCTTFIYDSTIMGIPMANLGESGSVFIPYNQFQMTFNSCAFQTDGKSAQYYFELVGLPEVITSYPIPQQGIKVLFDFVTPAVTFDKCGIPVTGTTTPPSTPTAPAPIAPTEPAKGNSGKGNSGKN